MPDKSSTHEVQPGPNQQPSYPKASEVFAFLKKLRSLTNNSNGDTHPITLLEESASGSEDPSPNTSSVHPMRSSFVSHFPDSRRFYDALSGETPWSTNFIDGPTETSGTRETLLPPALPALYRLSSSTATTSTATAVSRESGEDSTGAENDKHTVAGVTTPALVVQPASPKSLPLDIWLEICKHVKRASDLARMAQACSTLSIFVTKHLFTDVRICSPAALSRFLDALITSPDKARWVRTLTLEWPTPSRSSPKATATGILLARTMRIFRDSTRLELLDVRPNISVPIPCNSSEAVLMQVSESKLCLPQSIRSLCLPNGYIGNIDDPVPPVTSLSLSAVRMMNRCGGAARFGATLRRLRVERLLPWRMCRDSPARICATLPGYLPHLESLEVRDKLHCMESLYQRAPECDRVVGTELHEAASKKVPRLRRLTWTPVWGGDEAFVPGGLYHAMVEEFRDDLLTIFKLERLKIVLTRGRCLSFGASTESVRARSDE